MAWETFENIKGPKGDKGDTGTVASASVATLPAGESATVTITGESDPHMHLGVPRGDKGERGPAGSVSSASAESVPAGEQAAVIMSGTDDVKHMHVKVPRGLPGAEAVPTAEAVGTYLAAGDSPAQPGFDVGIMNILSDRDSAAGAELAERFGKLQIYVDNYGAVGDGVTDDTAAVAAAINAAAAFGGGTVVFTPGKTYMMYGFAPLLPGVHIRGYGAVITKPVSGRSSVAFFAIRTGTARGYGAAGSNFLIEGITTRGHANVGHSATLLSAHHAADVVVRNCTGILSVGRGHWVDLNGCDRVLVEDCTVLGAAFATTDIPGEAIQADISAAGSMSVQEDSDEGYDYLPSRNVTVSRTKFRQYSLGGVTYPAPVAFGTHTSPLAGSWYKNLRFLDCECEPTQDRTSGVRGVVRFVSADGVVVRGSKFVGGNVRHTLISVQPGYGEGAELSSRNVVIDGNFTDAAETSHIYLAAGTGVTVFGNSINGFGAGVNSSSGVFVTGAVTRFAISGNSFSKGQGELGSGSFAINLNAGASAGHGTASGNVSDAAYGGYGWADGRVIKSGNAPVD